MVVAVNVTLVAPPAKVTLAGTVAAAVLSLERLMTAPVAGAGPSSVTVPCTVDPPMMLVGLNDTELNPGVTCRAAA